MAKKYKFILIALPFIILLAALVVYLSHHNIAVLNPAGQVSRKEKNLFMFALGLSAIVVIPVFALTIMIAVKYREGNKKAKYTPNWDRSKLFESIWWGIPMVIIAILSVVTWNSSHALDPYKPIASKNPPVNIEVVALDWKWLFIYPEQNVASVNRMAIPLNRPINLYITSATVMNSFWVPNLSGQIYAMPGMTSQLHLMADKAGSYYGSSANISGSGFAGMNFMTVASSQGSFNNWVHSAQSSSKLLDFNTSYKTLATPSQNNPVAYYSKVSNDLFDNVIDQTMGYSGMDSNTMNMEAN
jgi:cytochrome o ubiquinol oxidase subunit 2